MTPVTMQGGTDCFRAVLASLFDLPLLRVPDFYQDTSPGEEVEEEVISDIRAWFKHRGCYLLCVPFAAPDLKTLLDGLAVAAPDVHYIVQGLNRRGREHMVIARGNRAVHDPSPGVTNIVLTPCDDGSFRVYFVGKII